MSAEDIAKAFVQHYYEMFRSGGPAALHSLYVRSQHFDVFVHTSRSLPRM
jgi:Nuclear transport factor 2 (NTF2) domain